MKKIHLVIIGTLIPLFLSAQQTQTAFLFDNDMAVFYPAGFDSVRTLPSMAIMRDLTYQEDLPADWKIVPVYGTDNKGRITVSIGYDTEVNLYGTGLVTGALRRNGTDIQIWNNDNWGYYKDDGKCLYQSHPWIMGVRPDGSAFGIIADHTWRQYFELSNPIKITTEGPAFRVVVIERENPIEMMKALGELTGKIELPPIWAIGYQQSRFSPSYTPDSRVKELADKFRKRNIPCDVIWMDINYMDNFKIFTFNPSDFPNPQNLTDYLHDNGFKAGYIIDPGVKKENGYFVYEQGQAGDHWVKDKNRDDFIGEVWPGECHFPDFTRPETRTWWAGLYGEFMKNGVDGAWNDMNEPGVFNTPEWTMPVDNIHRGGGGLPEDSHLRYHNVYGTLMTKASYEGILDAVPDKRPFVLSRGNHLGAQRYCATWTGDNRGTWEHMKMSIPMSITLGLSGQPFSGPDVGGYSQKTSPELLGHWMALSAYYPFSRNHTGEDQFYQEPWAFGKEIEDVSRTALNRRYRLLPYFYTLFREASQTGVPLMRPVFFADFADKNLREEEQAFLLGQDLLVIPRWAINPQLPAGDWDVLKLEDADDGYQPLVALRPGAIVPLTQLIQTTDNYLADSITLLVNPLADGTAEGILYNDAGNGFAYKTDGYELLQFNAVKHNESMLKVDITKTEGSFTVNNRQYRIGYVIDNQITYSDWTTDQTIYVPIIEDTDELIDLSSLGVMFVAGTFNDWKLEDIPMKRLPDGNFESKVIRIKAGTFDFKFANTTNWSANDWGNADGLNGTAQETTGGKPNAKFTILEEGNYIFKFNPVNLVYAIERTYNSKQTEMYVGGTFNDWTLIDGKMHLTQDSVWTVRSLLLESGNHELKFANKPNFSGDDWGNASGLTGIAKLTTGGKPNISFTISDTGRYTITFNESSLAYSITKSNTSNTNTPLESNGMCIYPNPATDILNIHTEQEQGNIEIFTLNGQYVIKQQFTQPAFSFDISWLKKGIYMLRINGNKGVDTVKLLKE